jgi:hypothetical protein
MRLPELRVSLRQVHGIGGVVCSGRHGGQASFECVRQLERLLLELMLQVDDRVWIGVAHGAETLVLLKGGVQLGLEVREI